MGGAPGEGVDRGHVLPRGEHRQQRRGRGGGGGHGEGLHTRHLVLAWNMDCSVFSNECHCSAFKIIFQYNAMSPQDLIENYLLWEERRHKSDTLLEPFSPT